MPDSARLRHTLSDSVAPLYQGYRDQPISAEASMLRHFVGQSHPSAGGEASKEHVDDDSKEHVDEAELLLALLQRCGPALTRRQASDFVRRSRVRPLPGPSWLPAALRWFGGRWRPKYSREAAVAAAAALAEVRRDSPRALPRVHSAYCSTHAPSLSDPVSPEGLLRSCVLLQERAEDREHGIVVVGNGRSILGGGAGAAVDAFRHVLRFNDYEIDGFARDVGSRTSLWVVSDWTRAAASSARSSRRTTLCSLSSRVRPCLFSRARLAAASLRLLPSTHRCVELLRKYPHRWAAEEDGGEGLPVLVAIPYLFLGEQHYQRYSTHRGGTRLLYTPLTHAHRASHSECRGGPLRTWRCGLKSLPSPM